jgi:NOL1/NOP2/fmu family ribosome biogenesis protein
VVKDMKILNDSEKKILQELLYQQHGVKEAFEEFILVMGGDSKIRATTLETIEVARKLRKVLQIGLYVAKYRRNKNDVFLSIEGSQLLNNQISKNVVELSEEECREWMRGAPIPLSINTDSRYIVGKIDKIYLGSARVSRDGKLYPQIAVWRRIPEE